MAGHERRNRLKQCLCSLPPHGRLCGLIKQNCAGESLITRRVNHKASPPVPFTRSPVSSLNIWFGLQMTYRSAASPAFAEHRDTRYKTGSQWERGRERERGVAAAHCSIANCWWIYAGLTSTLGRLVWPWLHKSVSDIVRISLFIHSQYISFISLVMQGWVACRSSVPASSQFLSFKSLISTHLHGNERLFAAFKAVISPQFKVIAQFRRHSVYFLNNWANVGKLRKQRHNLKATS